MSPRASRFGERRRYRACRALHGRRNVTRAGISSDIARARINFNYAAIPPTIMRTVIRRDCGPIRRAG